eukprot:c7522_g1_i2.p1 GENE.c7522_g1_i2~~c7522_g1_i2.p1  ORF type:complete len:199 (-),score=57.20 c7522_g1_i2:24-581(-)
MSDIETSADQEDSLAFITVLEETFANFWSTNHTSDDSSLRVFVDSFVKSARNAIIDHVWQQQLVLEQLQSNLTQLEEEEQDWKDMLSEVEEPSRPSKRHKSCENRKLTAAVADVVDSLVDECVSSSQRLQQMTSRMSKEVADVKHNTEQMHSFFEKIADQIHVLSHGSATQNPKNLIKSFQPLPL